jgi:hypothetical protein
MLRKLALVSFVGLVMIGGCGDLPDFVSAVGKLTSSDPAIGDLTAAEIVALSNHKADIAPYLTNVTQQQLDAVPVIDEATAQTIVDFFAQNGIHTLSDLQSKINDGSILNAQIPDSLKKLLAGMGLQL